MSVKQILKILTCRGATPSQTELIFPETDESEVEQCAKHITAIDECLQLLYRESSAT